MNLAKANFSNSNRIRCGQDYYDERMQASTRVSGRGGELFRTTYTLTTDVLSSKELIVREGLREDEVSEEKPADAVEKKGKVKTESKTSDPLNWFGILVPPALRASQTAFQAAIAKISKLASLDIEMRKLEVEIRRTRKKLRKLG